MAHHPAHTVIHHAGAWIGNKQVCNRCGELLADNPDGPSQTGKRMPYPEGALIISTRTYRAMTLTDRLPTCTPSPTAQAGATHANAGPVGDKVGVNYPPAIEARIGSEEL